MENLFWYLWLLVCITGTFIAVVVCAGCVLCVRGIVAVYTNANEAERLQRQVRREQLRGKPDAALGA